MYYYFFTVHCAHTSWTSIRVHAELLIRRFQFVSISTALLSLRHVYVQTGHSLLDPSHAQRCQFIGKCKSHCIISFNVKIDRNSMTR